MLELSGRGIEQQYKLANFWQTHQSIHFAQQAVKLGGNLLSKSYHALGLSYSKMATQVKSPEERKELQKKSIENLRKAHDSDPNDFLVTFHIALQHAELREVGEFDCNFE